VVKRLEAPKLASEHILIPETIEQKASPFALVLAVGTLQQGGISVGDTVILTDYCGAPCVVELDGERIDAILVPEHDVLAVVEE
jgi:co-chaperonin GroES (HSP10)